MHIPNILLSRQMQHCNACKCFWCHFRDAMADDWMGGNEDNFDRDDWHDEEAQLHLPADPTARPFDVSFKPNCDCHPSNIFSMIGYDITITNATPP